MHVSLRSSQTNHPLLVTVLLWLGMHSTSKLRPSLLPLLRTSSQLLGFCGLAGLAALILCVATRHSSRAVTQNRSL